MKRFAVFSLLLVMLVAMVPVSAQDGIESVCLVTDLGRVNDGTFNQYAHIGAVRASEEFDLEYKFIETQATTDYEANINTCVEEGFDVIITVGFLIYDATLAAAEANPDIYFVGVDQFVAGGPENFVGIQFREDQAGFLVGALAALVAEQEGFDTLAGVYGIDIPPVKKFRNGFEQGARYINPDLTLLGVYIPDFLAPDEGASAAEQFIGEGADIIFGAGGPTGSGGITAAAAQGVYVIGVDQDEYFTTFGAGETPGAEFIMSSALKRVDQGVYDMVRVLFEGDLGAFPGGSIYVMDAALNGVGFACQHDAEVGVPCLSEDAPDPDLSGDDEISTTMAAILEGLVNGDISTGVNPESGDLEAMGEMQTIADIVVASATSDTPEFTVLLAAVQAAGLTETLAGEGPFTVFAPTDAAFAAALEALGLSAEDVLADTELLTAVLTYHVVPGIATAEDVVGLDGQEVTTVNGAPITISVVDGGVVLNGTVNVIVTDIMASNGVIHVIDAVLLPPSE